MNTTNTPVREMTHDERVVESSQRLLESTERLVSNARQLMSARISVSGAQEEYDRAFDAWANDREHLQTLLVDTIGLAPTPQTAQPSWPKPSQWEREAKPFA